MTHSKSKEKHNSKVKKVKAWAAIEDGNISGVFFSKEEAISEVALWDWYKDTITIIPVLITPITK